MITTLAEASVALASLNADGLTLRATRGGALRTEGNVLPRHRRIIVQHEPALAALILLRSAAAAVRAEPAE